LKIKLLILLILILDVCKTTAQFINSNQHVFGGNEYEMATKIIRTSDGGFLMAGVSYSPASGNKSIPFSNPNLTNHYWLIKTDFQLNIEWQQIFGENVGTFIDITESDDGGYLVFLGTHPLTWHGDYFVIKLNASGTFLWSSEYLGNLSDILRTGIRFDFGYILFGHSSSDAGGDKTENSRGGYDYWIIRTDLIGGIIWDKTLGGLGNETAVSIGVFSNNDLLFAGNSTSNNSGDKSENNYSLLSENVWLVKTDEWGSVLWDKTLGGTIEEKNPSVAIYNDKIYCLIESRSSLSGNKTTPNNGESDYWLVKLDENGTVMWDKNFGGSQDDIPTNIQLIGDKIFLSGYSNSNISGDKNENSRGGYDYWLVVTDTNGNYLQQVTFGGNDFDRLIQTIDKGNGEVLLFGDSYSVLSGDKNLTGFGESDFWLVEFYNPLETKEQEWISGISLFPNPAENFVYINIDCKYSLPSRIAIYDLTGKLIFYVYEGIIHSGQNQHSVNTSRLSSGFYNVVVENDKNRIVSKLAITK
jgi:hypothetical protein